MTGTPRWISIETRKTKTKTNFEGGAYGAVYFSPTPTCSVHVKSSSAWVDPTGGRGGEGGGRGGEENEKDHADDAADDDHDHDNDDDAAADADADAADAADYEGRVGSATET